ncbi:MAG: cohesin domain-containing protein [Candidatus Stygibacter frigidus]|nr:cohesin domain-containing protein [Candidatus Stygibacter frigidus]
MKKITVIIFIGIFLLLTGCSESTNTGNPNDVNHLPSIELPGHFSFILNETLTEDFSVYVNDEDNDVLTLTVIGNTQIVITITGLIVEMSAPDDWTGTETVTFIVDDGNNSSTVSDVVLVNVVDPINPVITLESITVNNGAYFDIALTTTLIDSSLSVCSYSCTISYDINYLDYNSASLYNTLAGNMMYAVNEPEPGVIMIAMANVEPIIGEGPLAFFNFTALSVGETIIGIDNFQYNGNIMSNLTDSVVVIE